MDEEEIDEEMTKMGCIRGEKGRRTVGRDSRGLGSGGGKETKRTYSDRL